MWLPLLKEQILDEWWRIIFDWTVPDNWDDIIHRTGNSVNFVYKVSLKYFFVQYVLSVMKIYND